MAEDAHRVWFDRRGARLRFERGAQSEGVRFTTAYLRSPRRLRYSASFAVPVYDVERCATVDFQDGSDPGEPLVRLDGPPCMRHRYDHDGSLCMWVVSDDPESRWQFDDGLEALIGYIREHAFCEEQCRLGLSWPKAESAGVHPRKRSCPSCRGRGSP